MSSVATAMLTVSWGCAGYMVARVLGAAPILADAVIDQLAAPSDKAVDTGTLRALCNMCLVHVSVLAGFR